MRRADETRPVRDRKGKGKAVDREETRFIEFDSKMFMPATWKGK
jgi:hypothetical protein